MFRPTHQMVSLTTGSRNPVALVRSQQQEKGWHSVKTAPVCITNNEDCTAVLFLVNYTLEPILNS